MTVSFIWFQDRIGRHKAERQSKCVLQVVKFFCGLIPHIAFSVPQYSFIANDETFAVSLALLERGYTNVCVYKIIHSVCR